MGQGVRTQYDIEGQYERAAARLPEGEVLYYGFKPGEIVARKNGVVALSD